jgi:hypothetical protein
MPTPFLIVAGSGWHFACSVDVGRDYADWMSHHRALDVLPIGLLKHSQQRSSFESLRRPEGWGLHRSPPLGGRRAKEPSRRPTRPTARGSESRARVRPGERKPRQALSADNVEVVRPAARPSIEADVNRAPLIQWRAGSREGVWVSGKFFANWESPMASLSRAARSARIDDCGRAVRVFFPAPGARHCEASQLRYD